MSVLMAVKTLRHDQILFLFVLRTYLMLKVPAWKCDRGIAKYQTRPFGQPNGIKSVIYVESVGYSLTYAWRARMTIYLYSNICMQMTDSLLPFKIIIDLNDRFSVSRTSCFLIDERNFEAWEIICILLWSINEKPLQ